MTSDLRIPVEGMELEVRFEMHLWHSASTEVSPTTPVLFFLILSAFIIPSIFCRSPFSKLSSSPHYSSIPSFTASLTISNDTGVICSDIH